MADSRNPGEKEIERRKSVRAIERTPSSDKATSSHKSMHEKLTRTPSVKSDKATGSTSLKLDIGREGVTRNKSSDKDKADSSSHKKPSGSGHEELKREKSGEKAGGIVRDFVRRINSGEILPKPTSNPREKPESTKSGDRTPPGEVKSSAPLPSFPSDSMLKSSSSGYLSDSLTHARSGSSGSQSPSIGREVSHDASSQEAEDLKATRRPILKRSVADSVNVITPTLLEETDLSSLSEATSSSELPPQSVSQSVIQSPLSVTQPFRARRGSLVKRERRFSFDTDTLPKRNLEKQKSGELKDLSHEIERPETPSASSRKSDVSAGSASKPNPKLKLQGSESSASHSLSLSPLTPRAARATQDQPSPHSTQTTPRTPRGVFLDSPRSGSPRSNPSNGSPRTSKSSHDSFLVKGKSPASKMKLTVSGSGSSPREDESKPAEEDRVLLKKAEAMVLYNRAIESYKETVSELMTSLTELTAKQKSFAPLGLKELGTELKAKEQEAQLILKALNESKEENPQHLQESLQALSQFLNETPSRKLTLLTMIEELEKKWRFVVLKDLKKSSPEKKETTVEILAAEKILKIDEYIKILVQYKVEDELKRINNKLVSEANHGGLYLVFDKNFKLVTDTSELDSLYRDPATDTHAALEIFKQRSEKFYEFVVRKKKLDDGDDNFFYECYLLDFTKVLGYGGQAVVIKAFDIATLDIVAAKVLGTKLVPQDQKKGSVADFALDIHFTLQKHKDLKRYKASCDTGQRTILLLPLEEGVDLSHYLYPDKLDEDGKKIKGTDDEIVTVRRYVRPSIKLNMFYEMVRSLVNDFYNNNPPYIHRDIKLENFKWRPKEGKGKWLDIDNAILLWMKLIGYVGSCGSAAPETFLIYVYAPLSGLSDQSALKKNTLYCRMTSEGALEYAVINPHGTRVNSTISKEKLRDILSDIVKPHDPIELKHIMSNIPKVADYLATIGHTQSRLSTKAADAYGIGASATTGLFGKGHFVEKARKATIKFGNKDITAEQFHEMYPDVFSDDYVMLGQRLEADGFKEFDWLLWEPSDLYEYLQQNYYLDGFEDVDCILSNPHEGKRIFSEVHSHKEALIEEFIHQIYIFPKIREMLKDLTDPIPEKRLTKGGLVDVLHDIMVLQDDLKLHRDNAPDITRIMTRCTKARKKFETRVVEMDAVTGLVAKRDYAHRRRASSDTTRFFAGPRDSAAVVAKRAAIEIPADASASDSQSKESSGEVKSPQLGLSVTTSRH